MDLLGKRIGFVMCGSFCSFEKAFGAMGQLRELGAELLPVMSYAASSLDTRFGAASEQMQRAREISGCCPVTTIAGAEPIGPKHLCDLLLVLPCTGNTIAKLALGITDTPATMAVKSHLRVGGPVLLAPFTNDGLGAAAANIGRLMARKNIYFLPLFQDDPAAKPTSIASDLSRLPQAIEAALEGRQLQPMLGK